MGGRWPAFGIARSSGCGIAARTCAGPSSPCSLTPTMRTAPPATPTVNGMAEAALTVRVPFEERDLVAGREEFACHKTQYTPTQMDAVNRYLAHAWNGTVWLRPWDGALRDPGVFGR